MNLFYCPNLQEGEANLPEDEARHCVMVLRHRIGDVIQVVDGHGGWYKAEITATGKRSCTVRTITKKQLNAESVRLHMAVAPTKQIDRFEWFLEKATEIGVDEITPLLCHRSERTSLRIDRCQKVLLSAMKQSLRARLPIINPLTSIAEFLDSRQWSSDSGRFIATCHTDGRLSLAVAAKEYKDVIIMVGPEGDFEDAEIGLATKHGFYPVTLGPSRLRTETAGVVACLSIRLVSQIENS